MRLPCALAAVTLALAACGGGGDSGSDGGPGVQPPAPVLVNPALAMQGFWSGAVTTAPDGATRSSAVVMPDGTAWVVFETATATTAVAKIALTGTAVNETDATAAGSGNYYRLPTATQASTRSAASASATASTKGTFAGSITVTGNAATGFNWASVAGFTTQSLAADVVGTWNGSAGGSAVQVSWGILSTGALTGNSSTGCTYSGTLKPSAGTAVYDLVVAEDCAGTVRNMTGIATLSSTSASTSKNSLRVVFTADANATGGLFALTKQ
ncbi:hypothetical protein [Ramlibacter sp. AN1133]|uniref:hypothetical protein n=1 Tax=Ramlibacter sp. AN1133 TaxID=3133429 RepID=UPI0030BC1391